MHANHFTTSLTDKGYILLPVKVRKALKLKPKQTVNISVVGNKVEVSPVLTLSEVFSMIKPQYRKITQKELKEEQQRAHKSIAENARSEGI